MVRRGVTRNSNPNKGKKQQRKVVYRYFVDCSTPAADGIFDVDHFEKFVNSNYKAVKGGHKGDFDSKKVKLFKRSNNLYLHTNMRVSRQYLKTLTKKYLHKQELGEWLRVVSAPGKQKGYTLKYFNINNEEPEAEEQQETQEA